MEKAHVRFNETRQEHYACRDEQLTELMEVVEYYVLPKYEGIDPAHGVDHVRPVIQKSLKIARWLGVHHYIDVDEVMVLFIAAWHDVGRIEDEKHPHAEDNRHEQVSARMFMADPFMNEMFNPRQMEIMTEAIIDHRASNEHPPRSLYGMIIADGDRYLDYDDYMGRTIHYKIKHWPKASKEEIFQLAIHHLRDKYGKGGYLKLNLNFDKDVETLERIALRLAEPDDVLREDFDRVYDEVTWKH